MRIGLKSAIERLLVMLFLLPLCLGADQKTESLDGVLNVRITGTASFQDRAVALIEDLNTQTQAFYRVGDLLYGYEIIAIEPTRVLLSKGGKEYLLTYRPLEFRAPPPETPSSTSPNIYVEIRPKRTSPNFYVPPGGTPRWEALPPQPKAPATNIRAELGGRFAFPLASYKKITSPFGYRRHPIRGDVRMHTGVDLAAQTGTKIYAADSGTVIHSGWLGGYGYCVMVDHHNGYVSLYGHCSKLVVDVGDNVRRGDYIAQVGSTGASTGPHLHFEIRRSGTPIDPLQFFGGRR
jgi:murein DD-endopeptidase MepM/ murein hydrolase activator NlpD